MWCVSLVFSILELISNFGSLDGQCVLYIKAGAASMPVRDSKTGRCGRCMVYTHPLKLWSLEDRRRRADLIKVYKMTRGLSVVDFFTARRYAKHSICRRRVSVCVCLSHSGIVSKRLNVGSCK